MTNGQTALLAVAVLGLAGSAFALGRVTTRLDVVLANLADAPLVAPTQTIEIAPGVQIFVDAETGCQYLVGRDSFTPRIHSDGVPYCDDREEINEMAEPQSQTVPYAPAQTLDTDYARLEAARQHPTWRF